MSKERTQEQRDGFAYGVFAMSVFHIGIKLMKEPNWLTYLGFSMILFSIAMAWKFIIPSKKTKGNESEIEKLIKLANAIINPASDILPETYDEELNKYWNFIDQLNQKKNE